MPTIKEISSSTQLYTEIYDIANNMVITTQGTVCQILEIGTMNFGLLAEGEQDAAIYSYANLLNGLGFPIQILITSQTKDVTNYLQFLQEAEAKTPSAIKQRQIARYREFITDLVHEGNVLDKKFYAVVFASTVDLGYITPKTFLPWQKVDIDLNSLNKNELYEKALAWLEPKREQLATSFGRAGLETRFLQTQELIKLFYTNYNLADAEGVVVGDASDYTTPLITARTINE